MFRRGCHVFWVWSPRNAIISGHIDLLEHTLVVNIFAIEGVHIKVVAIGACRLRPRFGMQHGDWSRILGLQEGSATVAGNAG